MQQRSVYLNQEDARDIRNMNELFSKHDIEMNLDLRRDLWAFFRKLTVRLDNAGNKTKAWQDVKPGGKTRKQKKENK